MAAEMIIIVVRRGMSKWGKRSKQSVIRNLSMIVEPTNSVGPTLHSKIVEPTNTADCKVGMVNQQWQTNTAQ